jgi:hypothetical protein
LFLERYYTLAVMPAEAGIQYPPPFVWQWIARSSRAMTAKIGAIRASN